MATVYDALRLLSAFGWRILVQYDDYRVLNHPVRPGHLVVGGKPSDQLSHWALVNILERAGIEET